MMAKGYSNKESKNRTLQMQVRQKVEKIRGLDPPPPPKTIIIITHRITPVTLFVVLLCLMQTRSLFTMPCS